MAGVKGRTGTGNRKSIEELKLSGTFREDRHGHYVVPVEKRVRLEPQEHVTIMNPHVDREEIFNWFADVLHEQGLTQKVDSILLSQLVEAQAMYVTALAYYKQDPEAILGRKLASAVALEAAKEVRTLMSEFRLSPSTRIKNLDDLNSKEEDPVTAFLNAKVVSTD